MQRTHEKTLRMVQLAILVALVIVLQLVGSNIHVGPVSFSLVLIPIAVGGVLLGPAAGAILGAVFGLITVIGGVSGADVFTNFLFSKQPVLTVVLCLAKATLAGLCAGLVFRALEKHNHWVAVVLASAVAPVVNTGIFVLGTITLFHSTLEEYILNVGAGVSVVYFIVILCAGINFLAEFGVNLIASPAVYRIWTAVTKKK